MKNLGHKPLSLPLHKHRFLSSSLFRPSFFSFTYLARADRVGQAGEKHVANLRGLCFLQAPPSVSYENKWKASGHIRTRL